MLLYVGQPILSIKRVDTVTESFRIVSQELVEGSMVLLEEVALIPWNTLISLHSLHLLHHLHHQLSVLSCSLHNRSPSLRRRRRGRRMIWDLFHLWVSVGNPFRSHPVRDDHESAID